MNWFAEPLCLLPDSRCGPFAAVSRSIFLEIASHRQLPVLTKHARYGFHGLEIVEEFLCPIMCSILENHPRAGEMNVLFACPGQKVLHISVKGRSSRAVNDAPMPLLIISLGVLSVFDSEPFQSPTLTVWLSMSSRKVLQGFCFCLCAPALGVSVCTEFMAFWCIAPFSIMNRPPGSLFCTSFRSRCGETGGWWPWPFLLWACLEYFFVAVPFQCV